jgi:type I restriction enzyme, S subunit
VADPRWLYWRVISSDFQEKIVANSSATTLPIINKSRFQALELDLPPLDQQHEMVVRIERAFVRLERLAHEALKATALLDRLDQSILAKAFRGELVRQDPVD